MASVSWTINTFGNWTHRALTVVYIISLDALWTTLIKFITFSAWRLAYKACPIISRAWVKLFLANSTDRWLSIWTFLTGIITLDAWSSYHLIWIPTSCTGSWISILALFTIVMARCTQLWIWAILRVPFKTLSAYTTGTFLTICWTILALVSTWVKILIISTACSFKLLFPLFFNLWFQLFCSCIDV